MDKSKMSLKIWSLIGILVIAGWLLGSVTQTLAETKKFRVVGQFSRVEYMPVGDVEGHIFLLTEVRGLNFINGEVAIYSGWVTCDLMKGKGPCQGYYINTYEDGSTNVNKSQFIATIAPDGKTGLYEDGKGEYIKGTGRFEGIKGSMSFKGKRITPISPGLKETKGDFFVDGTMTYTLPPK
jgi:hypothetical protein